MKNIFKPLHGIKKLPLGRWGGFLGLVGLPFLGFVSCTEDVVSEYSTGQCYLYYDGTQTVLQSLNTAITSTSYFCHLWMEPINKSSYRLRGQLSDQASDSVTVSGQSTLNQNIALGKDNSKGLFIGRSAFQDGNLYVFDCVCPNCYNETHSYNYGISFDKTNKDNVICNRCKRTYSLVNGGVVVAGADSTGTNEKLYRYSAFASETTLRIQNP